MRRRQRASSARPSIPRPGRPRWSTERRSRRRQIPRPPELNAEALGRLRETGTLLLADHGERLRAEVRPVENPEPRGSFGFVGAFAEVAADELLNCTLVLALNPEQIRMVVNQTLRLFRWNPDEERFRLVQPSGVAADGSYIWGRIGAPGVYAAIGLHADPLVLHTVKTLCGLGAFMATLEPGRRDSGVLLPCVGDQARQR
jgi:hypothetical protein